MTKINIKPMPEWVRQIKNKLYRPMPPPTFEAGAKLTREDYAIAAELFDLLDPESQEWRGGERARAYFRKMAGL